MTSFIRRLKSLPLAIRFLLVLGPVLLLLSQFFEYLAEVKRFAQMGAQGPAQLIVTLIPTESLVVITGDNRLEQAALDVMKVRGTPFLIIAGGESAGFNLEELIRRVWGPSVDVDGIKRRILIDTSPPTSWAVARSVEATLRPKGNTRVIMCITDVFVPRCLLQFKTAIKSMEVIPFAVPSGLPWPPVTAESIGSLWYEFLKYMLWKVIYLFSRIF